MVKFGSHTYPAASRFARYRNSLCRSARRSGCGRGRRGVQTWPFPSCLYRRYFNGRYHKLGYGLYSTACLVEIHLYCKSSPPISTPSCLTTLCSHGKDEGHNYHALKVLSADCYGTGGDVSEREIMRYLLDADKTHVRCKYICHLVNDFEHRAPNGIHVCLVRAYGRNSEDIWHFIQEDHGAKPTH
jgi:hypothetical protein